MNRENCRPIDDALLDRRRGAADMRHELSPGCCDQLRFLGATVELSGIYAACYAALSRELSWAYSFATRWPLTKR